jgi:hypothetical protein
MLKLEAPVTDQLSVELPPDVMVAAVAAKLEITGAEFVELEGELPPPQPEIAGRRNNPMQNTKEDTTKRRSRYTWAFRSRRLHLHIFRSVFGFQHPHGTVRP